MSEMLSVVDKQRHEVKFELFISTGTVYDLMPIISEPLSCGTTWTFIHVQIYNTQKNSLVCPKGNP